jgi:hypothetical protein
MRAKQCHFELLVNFDRNSVTNQSNVKHEAIGSIKNRKKHRKISQDSSLMMANQKLCSVKIDDLQVRYAICELKRSYEQIRLIPIEGVYEFKTDFGYIDQTSSDVLMQDNQGQSGQSNELQRPICRYENSKESRVKKNTYLQWRKTFDTEPCVSLSLISKKLSTHHLTGSRKPSKSTSNELFQSIAANAKQQEIAVKSEKSIKFLSGVWSAPISFNLIRKMKPSDQLQCLLINCKVVRFDELMQLISFRVDRPHLLTMIQQYANLVQGNWVAKSHLLFPGELNRDLASLEGNTRLSLLFDCLCFCFFKQVTWKRCELLPQVKASFEEMLQLLQLIAKFDDHAQTWTFINCKDEHFLAK